MDKVNRGMEADRGARDFEPAFESDSIEAETEIDIAENQSAAAKAGYTEDEVRKLLQSEGDRRVNQAMDSFRKTEIEKLRRLAETHAEERCQSERAAYMDDYNKRLNELNKRALRIEAQSLLNERGLPASLIGSVSLADEAELAASLDALEHAFRLAVERGVNERLRGTAPETAAETRMSDRINKIIGIQ